MLLNVFAHLNVLCSLPHSDRTVASVEKIPEKKRRIISKIGA